VAYRTTPKMAERKEVHRAKLLQIAIRLFGKQGYHATTVPRIVRASRSSTGAFYFYFRNKDDIFGCALEAIGQQIAEVLNKAMASASEDTISQMRMAVETFILYLAEHPDEARILIVESSGLSAKLAKIRRSIIASHCRSVEKALASISGSPLRLDPKVVASCWWGRCSNLCTSGCSLPRRTAYRLRRSREKSLDLICGGSLRKKRSHKGLPAMFWLVDNTGSKG
jgi:TetR/AcrR family transcriptional regulator, fatty acid metabolism regulator protein